MDIKHAQKFKQRHYLRHHDEVHKHNINKIRIRGGQKGFDFKKGKNLKGKWAVLLNVQHNSQLIQHGC